MMSVFESPLRCLLLLQELPTGLKVRVMSYNLLADELVRGSGWILRIHRNIISPAFHHWLHTGLYRPSWYARHRVHMSWLLTAGVQQMVAPPPADSMTPIFQQSRIVNISQVAPSQQVGTEAVFCHSFGDWFLCAPAAGAATNTTPSWRAQPPSLH
jgi:hypothetical protein